MRYHLILGNKAYSSWSLRGWLLLEPFGIEFDHEVVPLYVPEYEQFLNHDRRIHESAFPVSGITLN